MAINHRVTKYNPSIQLQVVFVTLCSLLWTLCIFPAIHFLIIFSFLPIKKKEKKKVASVPNWKPNKDPRYIGKSCNSIASFSTKSLAIRYVSSSPPLLFSFVLPLIQDQVLSLRISCFYFFLFWLVSHSPKKLPTKSPKQKPRAVFFKWVCVSYSNINCGNYCWLKIGHKHWFLGSFMRNPNRFFVVFCLICVKELF